MTNNLKKILSLLLILIFISGCDTVSDAVPDWMGGGEDEAPMPGKRISVLANDTVLKADPLVEEISITVPTQKTVKEWPLQGTPPVEHPALKKKMSNTKIVSIGEGAEDGLRLTSAPIIANNIVYTLDAEGIITARSVKNLDKVLWNTIVEKKQTEEDLLGMGIDVGFGNRIVDKDFLGGHIAYGNNAIFVTTGRGEVVAFGSVTGATLWRRSVKLPIKSAPVISDNKLFFITNDNRLYALDSKTGQTIWTHSGIKEITSMLGASSPVVKGKIVIAPYSSGEIHALQTDEGRRAWSDLLVSSAASSGSSVALSDIDATPVISNNTLFAVSNDGVLSAFDIYNGTKLWVKEISSLNTPWVAGNFLYIITTDYELVCLQTKDGRVKWVQQLPSNDQSISIFGGKRKNGRTIVWTGPVLAGGKLLVVGSHGKLASFSPRSGRITDVIDIGPDVFMPPVIAHDSIFLLSNDADLIMIY